MVQYVRQIGVVISQNKLSFFFLYLCILTGCANRERLQCDNIFINEVDTLFLDFNQSILSYKYKDLLINKGFKKIQPKLLIRNDVDSTVYELVYKSDTLSFSYNFNIDDRKVKDRNIIYNNQNCGVTRIMFNGDYPSLFNGFDYDYPNALFYENDSLILIKSISNISLDTSIKLYQIVVKQKHKCYEFFVDENL